MAGSPAPLLAQLQIRLRNKGKKREDPLLIATNLDRILSLPFYFACKNGRSGPFLCIYIYKKQTKGIQKGHVSRHMQVVDVTRVL